jgi:uncharacterized membrane protein YphA (DoxX/SURF4 family)
MEKNVGGTERTARIVLGLVFVAASIGVGVFAGGLDTAVQGGVMAVLLLIGAVLLATAGSQKCVLNEAVGRNSYEGGDIRGSEER